MPHLSNLNVSKNALTTADDIENLTGCAQLSSVDFSQNNLNGEDIISTLSRVPLLLSLTMAGNPISAEVPHFRKRMIVSIEKLRYLDKPIFDMERASTEAWSTGGRDAELKVKTELQKKKRDEEASGMRNFRQWQDEIRAKAAEERERLDSHGSTPAQIAEEEERQRHKIQREEKAAIEAARERDIYRLDIPKKEGADEIPIALEETTAPHANVDDKSEGSELILLEERDKCDDSTGIELPSSKDSIDLSEDDCGKSECLWSTGMDQYLLKLAVEADFHFDGVSVRMGEAFDSDQFTSESCHLRWCLLVSAEAESNEEVRPLETFLSGRDERAERATFGGMYCESVNLPNLIAGSSFNCLPIPNHTHTYTHTYLELGSIQSTVVAKPTQFPSMHDDIDDVE